MIVSLVLTIAGWTLFGLVIVLGLLLDLLGLFGNWLILGAVFVAWLLTGHFGWWTLIILTLLATLGEILEAAFAGYGAAKFGGGKGAITFALAGCIIGAVVGSPWLPLVGTVFGGCLGAFIGATSYEYLMREKTPGAAMWTGFGASLGKIGGLLAKLFAGLAMLGVAALGFN